jgi:CO dehydrogenase/acetyl-CoA synthase beta subunit
MSSELFEKEYINGVIEYGGRPICKVSKIQITKLSLEKEGIQHIFMDKVYQNNDENEHREIDEELIDIFNKEDTFNVNCYDGDVSAYYSCKFCEKPSKGFCIISARII